MSRKLMLHLLCVLQRLYQQPNHLYQQLSTSQNHRLSLSLSLRSRGGSKNHLKLQQPYPMQRQLPRIHHPGRRGLRNDMWPCCLLNSLSGRTSSQSLLGL